MTSIQTSNCVLNCPQAHCYPTGHTKATTHTDGYLQGSKHTVLLGFTACSHLAETPESFLHVCRQKGLRWQKRGAGVLSSHTKKKEKKTLYLLQRIPYRNYISWSAWQMLTTLHRPSTFKRGPGSKPFVDPNKINRKNNGGRAARLYRSISIYETAICTIVLPFWLT